MKILSVLLIGALVFLLGCSRTPKENDQQAFESDLSEATLFMVTLTNLDSGDIAKARRLAEIPVFMDLDSLPNFAAKGNPTPEQKQKMVALARQALDYMQRHESEWDPRLPTVRAAVRGLQKILTEPEDVRRLQELSDYFAAAERKLEKEKP
jgi:hypothetical protein